jgi:hypothetical protein
MALAANIDRGKAISKLFKSYYGKADTLKNAHHLLENPNFSRAYPSSLLVTRAYLRHYRKRDFQAEICRVFIPLSLNYHPWDLAYSDLQRFLDWKADFQKQLKSGRVAQLQYIWLPNDHTAGINPTSPTLPASFPERCGFGKNCRNYRQKSYLER